MNKHSQNNIQDQNLQYLSSEFHPNKEGEAKEMKDLKEETHRSSIKKRYLQSKTQKKVTFLMGLFANFELILNIIYTIMFIIIVFLQFDIGKEYQINSVIKDFNNFPDFNYKNIFYNISLINDYNQFIFFRISQNNFKVLDKYFVVSPLRITQRRYKQKSDRHKKYIISSSELKSINQYESLSFNPYLKGSINSLTEETSRLENKYNFQMNGSFMNNGGYVISFQKEEISNMTNEEIKYLSYKDTVYTELSSTSKLILKLKESNSQFNSNFFFPSSKTSLLIYDYILYNSEINYLVPVYVIFYINPSGTFTQEVVLNYIRVSLYSNREDKFRLACEIIFLITFLIYIICFIVKVTKTIKKDYKNYKIRLKNEIKDKILKNLNEQKQIRSDQMKEILYKNLKSKKNIEKEKRRLRNNNTIKNNKHNKKRNVSNRNILNIGQSIIKLSQKKEEEMNLLLDKEIEYNKQSFIVFFIKRLLFKFPSTLCSLLFSILSIIYWIVYINKYNQLWNDIQSHSDKESDSFSIGTPTQMTNQLKSSSIDILYTLSSILSSYRIIICLNLLVIFSRLIIILKGILDRVIIFIKCFQKAFEDILSYIVIFLTFIFAFSLFFFIFFNKIQKFSTFKSCFEQIFLYSIVNIEDIYTEMYNDSPVVTVIIMILLIIYMRYILLKIILAILMFWFHFSANKYEDSHSDKQFLYLTQLQIFKLPKDVVYRMSLLFISMSSYIFNILFCYKSIIDKRNDCQMKVKEKSGFLIRKAYGSYGFNHNKDLLSEDYDNDKEVRNSLYVPTKIDYNYIENVINIKERKENIKENDNKDYYIKSEEEEIINKTTFKQESTKKNESLKSIIKESLIVTDAITLDNLPEDVVQSRLELLDDYSQTIRNVYFDSDKDVYSIKDHNETVYKKRFLSLIFYIIFLIVTVITLFYSTLTSYDSFFYNAFYNLFQKSYYEKEVSYYNITEINQIDSFLFDSLPYIFTYDKSKKQFIILNNNVLIKDQLIFTIKRNLKKNDFPYDLGIRNVSDDLYYQYNHAENRTSFNVNPNLTSIYSKNNSYDRIGGYIFTMDLNNYVNTSNNKTFPSVLNKTERALLINLYSTQIHSEALLINYEYNMLISLTFSFIIDQGSIIEKTILTKILTVDIFTYFSIITYVFDIFFIICYFFFLADFINKLKDMESLYERWHYDKIRSLSFQSQEIRSHFNHEVFRKLSYLFNFLFLIDLTVICLGIAYIVIRIIYICNSYLISNIIKTEFIETSLHIIKYYIHNETKLKDSYIIIGAILIISMSLRLLFLIDFGRFFGIVIKTIQKSGDLMSIFVILLLLTQPAFVSFSYIAFGYNLIEYSSWVSSLLYTLISLFGSFNLVHLKSTTEGLGALFFYLYIIIINLILINLFVVTLDRGYILVKSKIKLMAEDYDFKYVFCFCCYKRKLIYQYTEHQLYSDYEKERFKLPSDINIVLSETSNKFRFSETENIKLSDIDGYLLKELVKWEIVEKAYISIKIGGIMRNIRESLYNDLKQEHRVTSGIFIMSNLNKIINNIEMNLFHIERFSLHMDNYYSYQKFNLSLNDIKNENLRQLKDIEELEAEFYTELNELEKYQNVNKKIIEIEKHNQSIRNSDVEIDHTSSYNDNDNSESDYIDYKTKSIKGSSNLKLGKNNKRVKYDYDDKDESIDSITQSEEESKENEDEDGRSENDSLNY